MDLRVAVFVGSVLASGCFSPESGPGQDTEATGSSGTETGAQTQPADGTTSEGGATETTAVTSVDSTMTTGTPEGCTDASTCPGGEVCEDAMCMPCQDASDPDAACADADAQTPYCDGAGTCVACLADTCDGATPTCDPQVGCVPCTEHAQCPDSACHLLGPFAGTCFDASEVVPIADIAALETAFMALAPGDNAVFDLAPGTYEVSGFFTSVADELAILGHGAATITGGATNVVATNQTLYVAGLGIVTGPFRVFSCGNPGRLWIDDTTIVDYVMPVTTSCETHVRRSFVMGTDTTIDAQGATVFVENSAIVAAPTAGLALTDSLVDIRYANIIGAGNGITCSDGASGSVRNSMVVSTSGFVSVDPACGLDFANNAVGPNAQGVDVGDYDPSWFVSPGSGDLHLSASGQATFAGIAQWEEDDPLVDADGDARPQDAPGYPGLDEVP